MKQATTILAALAMGALNVLAGTPAPAPSGKGMPPPMPVEACPGGISYTNVELMYVYTDPDGGGDSGDGVNLRLSYALNQSLYIVADAAYNDYGGADSTQLALGIGGHISLTKNIDLAGDAGVVWVDQETSYAGLDDDDFGWYVRPHFRGKWGCLEAHLGALYVDVDGDSVRVQNDNTAFVSYSTYSWGIEQWSGFLDLYYHLNANWDIAGGVVIGEDFNAFRAGVRYRF
jgi:hypothetical protein